MTTDPGAVPPDASPLPDLDELDCFVKGESSPRSSPEKPTRHSNSGAAENNGGVEMHSMERPSGLHSSSLMQEDTSVDVEKGGPLDSPSRHAAVRKVAGSSSGATATYVATAVAGVAAGAGVVAAAGVAAAASAAAGRGRLSDREAENRRGLPQPRGKRMCRRCQAFKPPRAHHCRYVLLAHEFLLAPTLERSPY